jgi:hypothetical protein
LAANAALVNYSALISNSPAAVPTSLPPVPSQPAQPSAPSPSQPTVPTAPTSISSSRICVYGGYCRQDSDCVPGSKCAVQSQYYSQCVPDSSQYLSAGTGCLSDWGSKCSAGSVCCNPGAVCNSAAYSQCAPLQPPQCSQPSGYGAAISPSIGPTPSPRPSFPPTAVPTSPSAVPTLAPSRPTVETTLAPTAVPSIERTASPTLTSYPTATRTGFFSTSGNQIVDSSGSPVRLTGVNW